MSTSHKPKQQYEPKGNGTSDKITSTSRAGITMPPADRLAGSEV